MKYFVYIILILTSSIGLAQAPDISPQVINSAGDHRQIGSSGIYVTDNIGEPFIETIGPNGGNYITQGFIQPEVVNNIGFILETKVQNVSCFQKADGEIHLNLTGGPANSTVTNINYDWSPAGTCAQTNCKDLFDLNADTFSVKITINYLNAVGATKSDTIFSGPIIVADLGLPCNITIFSGISANGDGVNDVFTIKNIEEFPKNRVMIFNRWGKQIADITGYNNTNNAWPLLNTLDNLLSTTYFYLIDLGDGSKPIKGWVELMKN